MIADLHACGKRTLRARMKRLQLERSLTTRRMRVTEERTLLMIKPDGVRRGLVGRIITRIEDKGLKIVRIRLFQMDDAFAQDFYAEHCGKAYFPRPVQVHDLRTGCCSRGSVSRRCACRPCHDRRDPARRPSTGKHPGRFCDRRHREYRSRVVVVVRRRTGTPACLW